MSETTAPTSSEAATTATPMEITKPQETAPIVSGKDVVIVVQNKQSIEFHVDINTDTLKTLRDQITNKTMVPPAIQKIMLKGAILKSDEATLASLGIKSGSKLLLVGSAISDIVAVNEKPTTTPSPSGGANGANAPKDDTIGEGAQEKLPHKRILDKGIPSDVMPGLKNVHEPLPPTPLHGILNTHGDKVRLSLKIFSQELLISTSSQTERIPFAAIRRVVYEPIKGHEEYSIMGFQLGQTESSRYFCYWVPSQYVKAIYNYTH